MKSSSQQDNIIDSFLAKVGRSAEGWESMLKVGAGPGSGKTTTNCMLGQALFKAFPYKQGMYTAFNDSAIRSARTKLPFNVSCRTNHSMALSAIYKDSDQTIEAIFSDRISSLRTISEWMKNDRGCSEFMRPLNSMHRNAFLNGMMVRSMITLFSQSDDDFVSEKHFPVDDRVIMREKLGGEDAVAAFIKYATDMASYIWARQSDPGDTCPIGHDIYLRVFADSGRLDGISYYMIDEAQDSNMAMLRAARRWLDQGKPVLMVGDPLQSIYAWRGAKDAMLYFDDVDELPLTNVYRFGENIANAVNPLISTYWNQIGRPNNIDFLQGLNPNPGIISKGEMYNTSAILCRSNAGVLQSTMDCLNNGLAPHVMGGTKHLVDGLRAVSQLKNGERIYPFNKDLCLFDDYKHFKQFAESKEGGEWSMILRLVERGSDSIHKMIKTLEDIKEGDARQADIQITTIHKAKGAEYPSIYLHEDLSSIKGVRETEVEDESPDGSSRQMEVDIEDIKLFYVAISRAQIRISDPHMHIKRHMDGINALFEQNNWGISPAQSSALVIGKNPPNLALEPQSEPSSVIGKKAPGEINLKSEQKNKRIIQLD